MHESEGIAPVRGYPMTKPRMLLRKFIKEFRVEVACTRKPFPGFQRNN